MLVTGSEDDEAVGDRDRVEAKGLGRGEEGSSVASGRVGLFVGERAFSLEPGPHAAASAVSAVRRPFRPFEEGGRVDQRG